MTPSKMTWPVALATGALTLSGHVPVALAQSANDTAAIRQMIEQMKQDYEKRIRDLEQRLEKAEGDAQSAKENAAQTKAAVAAQPAPVVAPAPTAGPSPSTANPNAFNPAISAVLNGTFGAFSHDPGNVR